MRHILVTGGNGFIGQYVVEELQHRGHHPVVFDRHQYHTHQGIQPPYDVEQYFGDIKDTALVTDAVSHVDGVIHLAGILGTQETITNPIPAATTNILGGLNVIAACAQYDVPLVNIAVGNYWMNNTYSITKNSIERFVEMTSKYRDAAMVSVRALNAYGPRQVAAHPYGTSRVRKIMPSFICRALSGEPIEIYGDGTQIMDMIYVGDVARVLVSTLENLDDIPLELPIEAGTGVETTVNDIAESVAKAVVTLTGKEVTTTHLPMRPGEDEHSVVLGNPSSLIQVGIDPETLLPLDVGVARTVAYFHGVLDQS